MVVVGAGPLGAATAWQLARRGADVVLVERRDAGRVWDGTGGRSWSIRPGRGAVVAAESPVGPAGGAGHGRVAGAGRSGTSRDTATSAEALGLWRCVERDTGAALLSSLDALDHGHRERVAALAAAAGPAGRARWLPGAEAAARWPGLLFDGPVLHRPGAATVVAADHAVAALSAAATAHGATLRYHSRVGAIEVLDRRRVDVLTDSDRIRARRVVLAGARPAGLVARAPVARPGTARALWARFATPADAPRRLPAVAHHRADGDGVHGWSWGGGYTLGGEGSCPAGELLGRLREHATAWFPILEPDTAEAAGERPATVPVLERRGPVLLGLTGADPALVPALGRILADLSTEA